MLGILLLHTVIERAGFVDRRDQRNIGRNRWRHPGVMGEGREALKVTSQNCTELAGGGWVH